MRDITCDRTKLADCLAARVLHVSPTSASSSGLFVTTPQRTGEMTFVRRYLEPALVKLRATVIYADL
jgi:hypothetical protein